MQTGFDIAGARDAGYLATSTSRSRGSTLYRLDVLTGKTRKLGKIGSGRRLVVTGLAAWAGTEVGRPSPARRTRSERLPPREPFRAFRGQGV